MVDEPDFLQEELAAFEALYRELMSPPYSRRASCDDFLNPSTAAHDSSLESDSESEMDFSRFFRTRKSGRIKERKQLGDTVRFTLEEACHQVEPVIPETAVVESTTDGANLYTPFKPPERSDSPCACPATSTNAGPSNLPASPNLRASFRRSRMFGTGDKLFLDLLDDLDRISGNTPSARRRKKARDLFSDWLFSESKRATEKKQEQDRIKNRRSFSEYSYHRAKSAPSETSDNALSDIFQLPGGALPELPVHWRQRPRSKSCLQQHKLLDQNELILSPTTVLFTKNGPWSEQNHASERNPASSHSSSLRSDSQRVPINGQNTSTFVHQDDADSGYHTGDSTLVGHGAAAAAEKSGPGQHTLTREELRSKIDAFNDNQHGLLMTLEEDSVTFQGFIRVYMNLMRPISMSLPARPPSLYDVLTHDGEVPEPEETLTTSFYLPKDTTKVIHITSETTAQEVIKALLHKFKITDNPRKFALYEKIEENGKKPCMRRLIDSEKPLPLCLSWTADGLNEHKFVLQENDTGEIMWDAFSLPELENFLCILDREEEEYVEQIKAKFHLLLIQMQQQMKELKKKEQKDSAQAMPNGRIAPHTDSDSHEAGSSSPTTTTTPTTTPTTTISQNPEETTFLDDTREPVFV